MQKKEATEGVCLQFTVTAFMTKFSIFNPFKTVKTKEKQRKLENVKVKETAFHEISFEHQLYFKEITETCVGCDEAKRNVCSPIFNRSTACFEYL